MSFDEAEYARIRETCQLSALGLVPKLVARFNPRTVTDVGCGEGWFARKFAELGCDVSAVDITVPEERDEYLGEGHVFFAPADITLADSVVASDLTLCLEVAEHLPAESAAHLVSLLAGSAPVVVLSAATPGQGGCGHCNEQPPSYWADLFATHGYVFSDEFRAEIREDERIAWYYRRNLFVAATVETLAAYGMGPTADPQPATWQ